MAVGCVFVKRGKNNVDGDRLILGTTSGVYAEYGASGTVRGNVQAHICSQ